ncbi:Conserved_hypothetical protein [Hexamita inflata]|uniref:Uncharacterized protein n=1 Tax=Hexamita inflata TaxID=28002 RepID=A0AA86RJA4_9EUKA|nr:Conserved hypothetical protein [Hexamita inflata]
MKRNLQNILSLAMANAGRHGIISVLAQCHSMPISQLEFSVVFSVSNVFYYSTKRIPESCTAAVFYSTPQMARPFTISMQAFSAALQAYFLYATRKKHSTDEELFEAFQAVYKANRTAIWEFVGQQLGKTKIQAKNYFFNTWAEQFYKAGSQPRLTQLDQIFLRQDSDLTQDKADPEIKFECRQIAEDYLHAESILSVLQNLAQNSKEASSEAVAQDGYKPELSKLVPKEKISGFMSGLPAYSQVLLVFPNAGFDQSLFEVLEALITFRQLVTSVSLDGSDNAAKTLETLLEKVNPQLIVLDEAAQGDLHLAGVLESIQIPIATFQSLMDK